MQITKSTEHKAEKGLVPFKETVKEFPEKLGKFFSGNQKKTLIVTASVLVVCAAVAIYWMLFGPASSGLENPANSNTPGSGTVNSPSERPVDTPNTDSTPESFFAIAMTDRQRARDEALEVLQTVVDSSDSTGEEKTQAAEAMARIAAFIEAESNIETLVKSKGFTQCVAVVSEDNVSVIVGTADTLMANELAQIKEIVYLQTGIDPTAMRITEKIIEQST